MALTTPCSLSSPPPPLGHHSTGASLLPLRFFRSPPALQPLRSLLPFSPHVIAKPPYCSISASRSDEKKREILEGYGLDSSDFISYPSSSSSPTPRRKRKGRREVDMGGKGKRVQPHLVEELQPPRTTHRLLQVLGGKAHRKKLLSPKGMDVRPMMEVVRGAAFGILQVAGGCPAALRPGRWLDLYSGTGSVGIEAISRGCAEAHFVEMDPWVVSEVLLPNLEWTGFVDNSVIHTVRVERFLEEAEQSNDMDRSFDYVSVTPPYTAVDYSILMAQLGKSPLIGKDSFILVEYPLKTSLSESCGNLIKVIARPYFDTLVGFSHKNFISSLMFPKIADRRFGRTNLAVYGPTWAEKKRT